MDLVNLITGAGLLALGFFIKKYKMSYLIAGYNTSSRKEKEKYDEDKLVKSVGKQLMISAIILIIGGVLSIILNNFTEEIKLISWVLFSVYMIVWLVYINLSGVLLKK